MRAIVVIKIGRKRNMQASKMVVTRALPFLAFGDQRKSIIMMAFFFTMPINNTSDDGNHIQSILNSISASISATLADGWSR